MKLTVLLLTLLVVFSGYFVNESFAEVSENQPFLLEGSGFAVTDEQIRFTELDLGLSSQDQRGSTINFVIGDGIITLDDEEFIVSELEGKFLREGRYIRINGNIESSSGFDTAISFFGRLVADSKNASVYGFTGRIITSDDTYKIVYTAKLSSLTKIEEISTDSEESDITIHILKGSSTQKTNNIIPGLDTANSLRFFSVNRLSIEPGTTITLVNDDIVSHSIISGKENSGDRYNLFTPDGRISTGDIAPGESVTITFDGLGIYKLYDPDYTWMKIEAVSFPNVDNITFGTTNNQQGN